MINEKQNFQPILKPVIVKYHFYCHSGDKRIFSGTKFFPIQYVTLWPLITLKGHLGVKKRRSKLAKSD